MDWGNIGKLMSTGFAVTIMGVMIMSFMIFKKGQLAKVAAVAACVFIGAAVFGLALTGQLPAVSASVFGFFTGGKANAPLTPGFAK